MLDWISAHYQILSLAMSLLMLLVWIIYLQLFWLSYRRQLQANVIITRGAGPGLNARCLIGNMSVEAIYIQGILAVVRAGGEEFSRAITDLTVLVGKGDGSGLPAPGEGPLKAGTVMDVGSFSSLCDAVLEASGQPRGSDAPELEGVEIWVMADYSSESRPVLAKKKFRVDWGGVEKGRGAPRLRAEGLETRTIRSAAKRREIEQIFEDHLVCPEETSA